MTVQMFIIEFSDNKYNKVVWIYALDKLSAYCYLLEIYKDEDVFIRYMGTNRYLERKYKWKQIEKFWTMRELKKELKEELSLK